MPGFFPQSLLVKLWSADLLVSVFIQEIANVIFYRAIESPASLVPEYATGCIFLNMEEIKFAADYAMIIVERGDIASSYGF